MDWNTPPEKFDIDWLVEYNDRQKLRALMREAEIDVLFNLIEQELKAIKVEDVIDTSGRIAGIKQLIGKLKALSQVD